MSGKLKPNFTPVPNIILDEIMRGLNEGQFKTLMAICRYTYGWGKKSDRISLRQLSELTGIRDRSNVHRAIKRLGDLVIVAPGDPRKNLASDYRINVNISQDLLSQKQQDLLSDKQQPVVRPVVSSATIQRNQRKKIGDRRESDKLIHQSPLSPLPSKFGLTANQNPKQQLAGGGGAARGGVYPVDFTVNQAVRDLAFKNGWPDPDDELEAFRDYHVARGSRFRDWPAAFRTWLRNAKRFKQNGRKTKGDELTEHTRQALAMTYDRKVF